jgi:hypothetical protein
MTTRPSLPRLLGLLALAFPLSIGAQSPAAGDDRAAVLAVVRRLFDGMRAGDSASVRAAFHSTALLWSASVRNGTPETRVDSVDAFVRAVGTPHQEPWDERTSGEVVHLDGPLAVVWTDYSFYVGSRFSHCGVDTFQLARTASGWKIVALADTRRREGCRQ